MDTQGNNHVISNGVIQTCKYINGNIVLIPKNIFQKMENLFLNYTHAMGDFDYGLRALKRGFKIYCNYDAKLKIFPEESGDRKNKINKNIKNYYNHLFGINGGGNLIVFTKYAIKNCPKKHLPFSLVNGLIRRIGGYWLK